MNYKNQYKAKTIKNNLIFLHNTNNPTTSMHHSYQNNSKNYIFIIVLFFAFFHQCSSKDKYSVNDYEKYLQVKDNSSSIPENEKKCIDFVKQGIKTAETKDAENKQSESFFNQSIEIASKCENPALELWAKTKYAQYLYQYRNMPKSLPLVLYIDQHIKNKKPNEIIEAFKTYQFLGYYFTTIKQYNEGILYLKKASTISENNDLAAIYDNIGVAYNQLKNYPLANKYHILALEIAKKHNDQERIAKIYGNLAQLHLQKNEIEKAVDLLKKDMAISEKINATKNKMFAQILLAKVELKRNNKKDAEINLNEALKIAESKPYFKSSELEILKLITNHSLHTKTAEAELTLRKRIDQLEKELEPTDGPETLVQTQYQAQIAAIQLQKEKEKTALELTQLKNNLLIAAIILILLISVLILKNINKKLKIEKTEHQNVLLSSEIEKINSENRLKEAQHSIESYYHYLNEKNYQIEKLNTIISQLEKRKNTHNYEKIKDLKRMLDSHLMTDENWFRFKDSFIQTYPDYYEYLQKNFPELTESNLRLILLFKLGINTKEIPNFRH